MVRRWKKWEPKGADWWLEYKNHHELFSFIFISNLNYCLQQKKLDHLNIFFMESFGQFSKLSVRYKKGGLYCYYKWSVDLFNCLLFTMYDFIHRMRYLNCLCITICDCLPFLKRKKKEYLRTHLTLTNK